METTKPGTSFTQLGLFLICASLVAAIVGYGLFLFSFWKDLAITPISEYLHPHGKLELIERAFPENLLGFALILGPLIALWALSFGILVRCIHPSFPFWTHQMPPEAGTLPDSPENASLSAKVGAPENWLSRHLWHSLKVKITGLTVLGLAFGALVFFLSSGVATSDAVFEKIRPGMPVDQVREILKNVPTQENRISTGDGKPCLRIAWEEPTLLFGVVYQIDFDAGDNVVTKQRMD
jgi:hypothetical protein